MQNASRITFVMKEMVKHLVNLVFVNAIFIFLVRKRTRSGAEYNIKLIGQPTNYFKFSAAAIGISSAVIIILIVTVIKIDQDVMVVIAAVFISIGTGRQIFASALDVVTTNLNAFLSSWASTLLLLAKNRVMVTTTDWRSIERRVELILYSRRLEYNLPVKLDGVKPESQQILLEYLDEHKWELEYQQAITYDDSSFLAFVQYATKQMREKMQIYDELEELQERSGGVNAVILIALGTLIWLIS
ncbi:MAG TPA: hypothetical protein VKA95_11410 [Nitrososphaeraceae archaeon]|jgi:hypothetical protein|nr:hypothetical protein [Nitrososphaeraceae archaeon]